MLKKDIAAARQSFEKALALAPKALDSLDGLIAIELGAGRGAAARALADKRLAEDPKSPSVLHLAEEQGLAEDHG